MVHSYPGGRGAPSHMCQADVEVERRQGGFSRKTFHSTAETTAIPGRCPASGLTICCSRREPVYGISFRLQMSRCGRRGIRRPALQHAEPLPAMCRWTPASEWRRAWQAHQTRSCDVDAYVQRNPLGCGAPGAAQAGTCTCCRLDNDRTGCPRDRAVAGWQNDDRFQ